MEGSGKLPAKRGGIELLPQVTPSGWEKFFIFWAKRIVIPLLIALELLFLLLSSFRAKLEVDLRSVDFSVGEKEETLAAEAEFEQVFRTTQAKLSIMAQVKEDLCISCAIDKLYSLKTATTTVNSVSTEKDKLTVSAQTSQAIDFALFVDRILKDEGIKEAAITGGALNSEGQFSFAIEMVLDKEIIK
jgi:hypothetical protein